jgi:hypothetical protein
MTRRMMINFFVLPPTLKDAKREGEQEKGER